MGLVRAELHPNVKKTYWAHNLISFNHTELFRAFKTELHLFFSPLFIGKLNLVKCTIFATDYESLKNFDAKIIMRLPYKFLKFKARNL